MVTIQNGEHIHLVTEGAFQDVFSKLGYKVIYNDSYKDLVEEETPEESPVVEDGLNSADLEFVNALEEKPISQWSKAEIKKYAEIKCIDITGTKSANEAREIIKGFIEMR